MFTGVTALLVAGLRDSIDPEKAGLALLYVSSLGGLFQFTSRMLAECEARFTAVERITSYIETLPEEHTDSKVEPPASWPEVRRRSSMRR